MFSHYGERQRLTAQTITKRVVPRCVYTETQTRKFRLLRIELSGHSFSGHIFPGLLIFILNVNEKIHTYVNSLERRVEEVLKNPSFVVSL